jgi:two-component system capsular synthesis response regulator RcsB
MKKINLTIVSGGLRRFPGCADLLQDYPEFRVVAGFADLEGQAVWTAIAESDVLLLDLAAIEHGEADLISQVCEQFPLLKVLLILDQDSDETVLDAIARGVVGVMQRSAMRQHLRKAIPVLYSGEPWISRDLVHSLRKHLQHDLAGCGNRTGYPSPGRRDRFN